MKKLIKLWKVAKSPRSGVWVDLNKNMYYRYEDGWYMLNPYTGEITLTDLPAAELKEKRVEIARKGRKYSLNIEDKLDFQGQFGYSKNVIFYTISKGENHYLKIYDIKNGNKLYELKSHYINCFSSVNSRYLVIYTFDKKKDLREIIIYDTKRKATHKFDTASSALLWIETALLDMTASVYLEYDLVKILISLRDSLREYNYGNPIPISINSIYRSNVFMNFGFCESKKLFFVIVSYIDKKSILDFVILNFDGDIKARWVTSPKKFEKLIKVSLSIPKLTLDNDVFNLFKPMLPLQLLSFFYFLNSVENTYVFSTKNSIVALEIKENSARRKWIKKFRGDTFTFYSDYVEPYCLVFNEKSFMGKIVDLRNGNEIYSGSFPDKPDIFFSGIIIFYNGTAYGVRGIFEDMYAKKLEKLLYNAN